MNPDCSGDSDDYSGDIDDYFRDNIPESVYGRVEVGQLLHTRMLG